MRKRLLVLIAVAAMVAIAAGVAKACEITVGSVFCINGQTYTTTSYGAAIDYTIAAEQGGFYVPTYEVSEEIAELPTGFDDDEFLPSEVESTEGLTLFKTATGACAVAAPIPPSGMFLCYSHFEPDGGYAFADTKTALAALKDPSTVGWTQSWAPYAVMGPAPSANYPVVGSFYLTCQLPSGKSPNGLYHGGDGPGASDSISNMDALTAGAAEYPIAA